MQATVCSVSDSAQKKFAGSSERRKAQNRASQRNYREKRRKLMQEQTGRSTKTHVELVSPTTSPAFEDASRICRQRIDCSLDRTSFKNNPAAPSGPTTVMQDTNCDQPDLCPLVSVEPKVGIKAKANLGKAFSLFFPLDVNDAYFHSQPSKDSIEVHSHEIQAEQTESRKRCILNVNFTPVTFNTSNYPAHPQSCLSDIYVNNLSMHDYSFVTACYINALHIGIQPDSMCQDSESCFFRPGLIANPFKDALVESIRRSFTNLTPDLRPSEAQLTLSHNAYIDILPFPKIRERMVYLSISAFEANPDFDEDDLCNDMISGGLVCRGYVGASRHDGQEAGGGGNPWERGSWEAEEWFLKKWRLVLGDEDEEGGLWKISRGWKAMRGDNIVV